MKRALAPALAVLVLIGTAGCSAPSNDAQPVPTVTVTETVRVPAPDYTPQDDAAIASEAGVSEFAVGFAASYRRETGVDLTPEQAQERVDQVCAEIAAGSDTQSIASLPEAEPVIRSVFAEAIQKSGCS